RFLLTLPGGLPAAERAARMSLKLSQAISRSAFLFESPLIDLCSPYAGCQVISHQTGEFRCSTSSSRTWKTRLLVILDSTLSPSWRFSFKNPEPLLYSSPKIPHRRT